MAGQIIGPGTPQYKYLGLRRATQTSTLLKIRSFHRSGVFSGFLHILKHDGYRPRDTDRKKGKFHRAEYEWDNYVALPDID